MAEPTLEELLAYQEERARAQQAQQQAKTQEQTPSGLIQSVMSMMGAAANPAAQPLAPYDAAQGAIKPRTLMDIIFSRR
jgi:hypothetical protein